MNGAICFTAIYLASAGAVRIVDPAACHIDYRLNLLGVRVREKDCQLRNHAKAIAACDFFVVVRASFSTLYVFVIMELGSRRIKSAGRMF